MLDKLDALYIGAQTRWNLFWEDFKNDETGLSGIVVAVLLIVIGVLAVAIIWKLLKGQLNTWWSQVTGETFDKN